jgi:MFS family permease
VSRYLRILRRPAALVPFGAAVLARLPISMVPLGMVLLIQQVRGTYTSAGLVTAAYALGSASGAPLLGRAMDAFGQPQVLLPAATVSAGMLTALAIASVHGVGDGPLIVLAAVCGLTFPVITPAMRGAWRVLLSGTEDLDAAYALDATAVETIFVGGPLLLSALLLAVPPVMPLLVTAGLLFTGTVGYVLSAPARTWVPAPPPDGPGTRAVSPLRARGMPAVLAVSAAMAVGFGHLDVAIAATAREVLNAPTAVGLLFAAVSGGSVTGGLWYGARTWRTPEHRRLPVALTGFALGLLVLGGLLFTVLAHLPAKARLGVLLPVLFATGMSVAPSLIVQQSLVDGLAPQHRLGEAQSWLTTGLAGGSAAGTAIGGVLVDLAGPGLSYTGAAAAVAVAVVLALMVRRRWPAPGR